VNNNPSKRLRRSGRWVSVCAAILLCFGAATVTSATPSKNDKAHNKAERALRAGNYQEAEKLFRQLLTKDPDDIDARLGLSRALLKQRLLQDAFDHAARAITLDPLSASAHALLGTAVLASGRFRQSIEEFRTALSLNEDEPAAIAGLAMVDFYENRLTSCIIGLQRAIVLDSNEPDYLYDLGQAAARSERYKEGADAYERFLAVAPKTDAERRARIRGLIDFLRFLGQQGRLYSTSGAERSSVSFEAPDYRPIIRVRVNGSKESLRFVVDTGSGMSVISEGTARKLGMHPIARGGLARAVGGGGRFEMVYGYLSSVAIGDVRVENVPVYIRHFYDEKIPVDGYIGISALGAFVTSVDYGTRSITFVRQRNTPAVAPGATEGDNGIGSADRPGIELPLRLTAGGFISSEVNIEGLAESQNFIVDTGASVTVISEQLAATEEVQRHLQKGQMRVYGAAGVAENVKIVLLPRIAIGGYSREGVDAAVLDMDPVNETAGFLQSGILGGNFLRHFRVIFNFQRAVIKLEPLVPAPIQNENMGNAAEAKRP